MKVATAKLRSVSPYSQSRHHMTEKLSKENARDYEKRTWIEHLHYDPQNGEVFIHPMALKQCLDDCAKYISKQVPGKGKATYTKHFKAGVLLDEPAFLNVFKKDIEGEWIFANADGIRGSNKRVERCYPVIPEWETTARFLVLDDTITKDVFEEHLTQAGQFIGVGRFRPQNGGYYGRFEVEDIQWSEE